MTEERISASPKDEISGFSVTIESTFIAFARSTVITAICGTRNLASSTGYCAPIREGKLVIKDETFWFLPFVCVAHSPRITVSEAYMNDEVNSPSMKDVLNIYIDNFPHMSGVWTLTYKVKSILDRIVIHRFLYHGLSQSILNVAGYDAANDLYKAFLSQEMQYSCPIWSDKEGGVRGDLAGQRSLGDLERAQEHKIGYILSKASARAPAVGDREWVGKSRYRDSKRLWRRNESRKRDLVPNSHSFNGLQKHASEKAFDACIALEMVEAVGIRYMPTFIRTIDWALKDGIVAIVLSATCYPDSMFSPYKYGSSFCATWLAQQFQTAVRERLSLESVEDYGSRESWTARATDFHLNIHGKLLLMFAWMGEIGSVRLEENWTQSLYRLYKSGNKIFRYTRVECLRAKMALHVYMEVIYSRV
ncbi:uncharacterized protein BT62DRAFT_918875 [Guyanagaster necrorhizus]|uniref:Uncharacterized protein n=1 Tax=Guyanagaster necrorhizus TaxID=856835 RepID=A0A9P8AV69_9AGAR|nr:uncharacterized protein BT62DRAFT_918875 [Guyanagaster necrorhizus MCA 3950]KAG7447607.1 hypothetical protein BT62DRAFT_918875 [Guyanagaster necrorhizus MCA 3950]